MPTMPAGADAVADLPARLGRWDGGDITDDLVPGDAWKARWDYLVLHHVFTMLSSAHMPHWTTESAPSAGGAKTFPNRVHQQ